MRGRPKMDEKDKRSERYLIRFRKDELDSLKKLAARAGVSVPNYIRTLVDHEVMNTLMNGEEEKSS